MLRRIWSMRLLSWSALPCLAVEAAVIGTAWAASGPGADVWRALCIAGGAGLAVSGGWWLTSPRPPGTRADRRRLAEALSRIADGRAWVTPGHVLRCQAKLPGSWELLVADSDQDTPGVGGLVPVTFTSYTVSRRSVSRRTGAWLMEPDPDGALTQPPEPSRSRRERAASAIRVLRIARSGLLDADVAEIAGLTLMTAAAVRYRPD
jgi:hypothetical protein